MLFVRLEERTCVKQLICFTKKKYCGIPQIRILKITAADLQIEKAEVENRMSSQSKEN